ncbi:MAG: glycoside hydrolase family 38 C-terminal domain-containing protein [Chitinivibrionales bacterium]|nr:glycoside hydrolase family 38 C-terminal domain-containing protein [Chitinivibrionales bacterium]
MALTAEWRKRIDHWRRELKNHFYRQLGTVDMGVFFTLDRLQAQEAGQKTFRPIACGDTWGKKWEYAWFKGALKLPAETAGKRIVLRPDCGGDGVVYINGKALGGCDKEHKEIPISQNAAANTGYAILIETYAGHGEISWGMGPIPPERRVPAEVPEKQATFRGCSFGVWEEELYQLWLDAETLTQLRDKHDPESLLVAAIDEALRNFSLIVDFEENLETLFKTAAAAREALKPLLACKNGTVAPTLFTIGHSHLDVAWLWPLRETEAKCVRTLSTQLALMEAYPEFKYLQSQPHLYRMAQTACPELYERVKKAAAAGTLVPEGGMWVEADTNITGGESLIRQFLHGLRFFKEEFGVQCEMLWLPDVFGYSGALPQIMRGCGINYFATAKIFWMQNGGDPFPYNTFLWEGIDGSAVLTHLINDYASPTDPNALISRWNERVQKSGISTRLIPFGHGDGGGGATRDHLEFLRRSADLQGVPKTVMAHPCDFFRDQEKRGIPEARYVGELYFQGHRGTYTSQARTKKSNRQCEFALREAEMWSAFASLLAGNAVPSIELENAWKKVLLNQFHDIIPGSSIRRVYEEAESSYQEVLKTAAALTDAATAAIVDKKDCLTIFNSLCWPRTVLVPVPPNWNGAKSVDGEICPLQKDGDACMAEVRLPACGWTSLEAGAHAQTLPPGLTVSATALENSLVRYSFNDKGEITEILDKETGRQVAAGPCNSFKMYKDIPAAWDAWDIDSTYKKAPVELPEKALIEVVTTGPIKAVLRVKRKLHDSIMTQEIALKHNSRRLDFVTTIDWAENHKLLKVNFPVCVLADQGVHEIQFGHVQRPNHASRPFDADRFEVCNHKWSALLETNRGAAVLNDCKYGINIEGNSINLTLLKAALGPDHTADRGLQQFTYSFYFWNGTFNESDIVRQAYDLNCPVVVQAGSAQTRSIVNVDAANIIVETIKPAEDGSGDIVLRLYECKHSATRCAVRVDLPVKAAMITDMLENKTGDCEFVNNMLMLDFRPFEIKTVRLVC